MQTIVDLRCRIIVVVLRLQDGDVARHGCWPRPLGALHTSESTLPVTCLRETSIGTRLLVVMGTATGEDPGRFNCEDFVQLNTFI
jgi:hypothetical protein